MDHPFDFKNGITMGGWARSFEDTSLIDSDIDYDRTFLHLGQHFAGNEARSLGAGDEDSTDNQIRRAE